MEKAHRFERLNQVLFVKRWTADQERETVTD